MVDAVIVDVLMELATRVESVALFPDSIVVVKVLPITVEKYKVDAVSVDVVMELATRVESVALLPDSVVVVKVLPSAVE